MARIHGRRPGGTKGKDRPAEPAKTGRVEAPVSGRRGRIGYYAGFRPERHRWIGLTLALAGVAIAVLNDAQWFTEFSILPFGHQEFWLIAGLLVAGSGTWFLGLFDPSIGRRQRTVRPRHG